MRLFMRRALSHLSVWTISAAIALGISAMAAHAAEPAAAESDYVLSMQTVNILGHAIALSKYFKQGKLCQQYVQSVSHSEDPMSFKMDVQLSEVCDEPEARKKADGSEELFPKKLVEMRNTQGYGYVLQLPIVKGMK